MQHGQTLNETFNDDEIPDEVSILYFLELATTEIRARGRLKNAQQKGEEPSIPASEADALEELSEQFSELKESIYELTTFDVQINAAIERFEQVREARVSFEHEAQKAYSAATEDEHLRQAFGQLSTQKEHTDTETKE